MESIKEKNICESIEYIYGQENTKLIVSEIKKIASKYICEKITKDELNEKDVMIISYGDSVVSEDEKGLETLRKFFHKYVGDSVSAIHLLPMFPFTSDDGFSVVDYKEINPKLGDWSMIRELSKEYELMFDAVVNHVSQKHQWFQAYLQGEEAYEEYFIECDKALDYSKVTRPRSLPLLTEVETSKGKKNVWTTFSEDQIDLNYKSEKIFLEILDVLMSYAHNGARFIRLDAIGFLWKEIGTNCMHLPKTHEIIKAYRKILDIYFPNTKLITETNVPHEDNISYFGKGDEAHMVYQFPLPPLVMFSMLTQDATKITNWAKELGEPQEGTTYFNFLSSHDGIGVRPVEGILTQDEQQILIDATLSHGGIVSYKDNGDGTKSPYELNVNYQDALSSHDDSDEIRIKRFLAAETILLSLQGVPGIYIHSLIGSRNDYYGKTTSEIPRRINRQKVKYSKLEKELTTSTNRKIIFDEMIRRLNLRKENKEFSPKARQRILSFDKRIFALERYIEGSNRSITILINVSLEEVCIQNKGEGLDILSGKNISTDFNIEPLQCMWILKKENK